MTTPQSIAKWMLEKIKSEKILYQEIVVYEILEKFGEEFTYINQNGNLAIDKRVLREFRTLTENIVVWERGSRFWRYREDFDNPDKRQVE